jgi:hypothetical protein
VYTEYLHSLEKGTRLPRRSVSLSILSMSSIFSVNNIKMIYIAKAVNLNVFQIGRVRSNVVYRELSSSEQFTTVDRMIVNRLRSLG